MAKEKNFYQDLQPFLNCKDQTVSNEVYQVMINKKYDMLVTNPVPHNWSDYYKSEDYISHTDSKKSLIDKVYQSVKNITLKRKLKLINSFETSSKNILDVGAGTGDFLNVCKNNGWNTIGVEPSISAINISTITTRTRTINTISTDTINITIHTSRVNRIGATRTNNSTYSTNVRRVALM